MTGFTHITPAEITDNPFDLIGKDWLLVTAEKDGRVNTMTASWGAVGILWNRPAATIYLRPQRYTKEFVDGSDTFSLSVLPGEFRDQLAYCGRVSGRDEDKIKKAGLTVERAGTTPYFAEARLVLICRKMYVQPMTPDGILDEADDKANYAAKDYHVMYVAQITDVLKK